MLSSVAILYHELGDDLDAAVQASLGHLRELVGAFDTAAAAMLAGVRRAGGEGKEENREAVAAVEAVVGLMRMINTGNLEWRYV